MCECVFDPVGPPQRGELNLIQLLGADPSAPTVAPTETVAPETERERRQRGTVKTAFMVMDEWEEEGGREEDGGTPSVRCHGNSVGSITQREGRS